MKLFIAVRLNDEILRTITNIQSSLRWQGVTGNFTRAENLHLTLAFIGDYHDPDFITDIMRTVTFRSFELSLEGLGNYGDLWWAGIRKNDALSAYVRNLRRVLADAGIPFDRKKFSPHITLVRRASFVIRPEVVIPEKNMTVTHTSLFRSDQGKNGMIYTELSRVSCE